jgi:hypothetical protein
MPNYSKFREKDIDGRWFEFDHQQMGNSCGPASVKNIKMLVNNCIVGESALRGIGTMHTFRAQNTGESPLSAATVGAKDWEFSPTGLDIALAMLKSQPASVSNAHQATSNYRALLQQASRNHPILIGWLWSAGGGHFNVCVGPTKTDPSLCVILDPALGLQYLSLDDAVGNTLYYRPGNAEGRFTAKAFEPFITT